MIDDSSNPFHQLAKELAARRQDPASGCDKKKGPSPTRTDAQRMPDNGDDAALFFDAVQRIKPLKGGKTSPASKKGASMGELLATGLKERSGGDGDVFSAGPSGAGKGQQRTAGGSGTAQQLLSTGVKSPEAGKKTGVAGASAEFAEALEGRASQDPNEEALFAKAMTGVARVNGKGRDVVPAVPVDKRFPAVDPAQALRDVLEGRVEFALMHTDEFMEGHVVGLDPQVSARLRNGQYSPEKHLDMHGMNARQAYDALTWFIKDAYQRGLRTVVVVTGRGKNSPDGVGVLRPLLQRWLSRDPFKRVVLAFCSARPCDGGAGAVYVLLRKYKKSRGKIIWDFVPSDDDFADL